jgi:GPH family glycoside/pentoside/hexuronide:cation symporter
MTMATHDKSPEKKQSNARSDSQVAPALASKKILAYAGMYMPISMALLPVGVYVQPYYAELGISLYAMSAIIFFSRFSDVITDPLIGVLSDKTKSRWGRRKPWLVVGTPLMMISVYMLFVPGENPTLLYFGFWTVLMFLAFTVVDLPYYAWGAELSTDYDERTLITTRREQFHFLGTVTAVAIPLLAATAIYITNADFTTVREFFASFSEDFRDVMASRAGNPGVILEWLAAFVVVVLPLTVLLAVTSVSEPDQIVIPRRKPTLKESFSVVRRNGPFMRLIICYTVSVIGASMTGALSYFFVKHVIQAGELYPIYLLVYYLASVLGLPLWMRLSKRIGKHRAFTTAIIWFVFWASFIPFIPAGWFSVFLIVMAFKGSAVGALLAMPASMAADAVDIDSARTGQQRAGLYFSVWGMSKKGGTALGGALGLAAIQFFGFDPQADPTLGGTDVGNSGSSLIWLAVLYSIIPAAFKVVALPFIWRYPLTEARQIRIRARLKRRGVALKAGSGDSPSV